MCGNSTVIHLFAYKNDQHVNSLNPGEYPKFVLLILKLKISWRYSSFCHVSLVIKMPFAPRPPHVSSFGCLLGHLAPYPWIMHHISLIFCHEKTFIRWKTHHWNIICRKLKSNRINYKIQSSPKMLDLAWAIRDYSSVKICHISPNLGWTPWRCFPGVERWRVSSRYLSTEVLKMINSMGYNASTKESYILSNTVQTIGKSWWFAVALPSIRNKIPLHYQKNILSVTKRKMVLNNSSTNLLHSVSSLHDAQLVRTWREIPLQSKTFPYQLPEPFCTFPSFPSVPMQLHQPLSPSFPRIWKSKKKKPNMPNMWFKKPIQSTVSTGPVGLQIANTFQTKGHTLHCHNKQEEHEKTFNFCQLRQLGRPAEFTHILHQPVQNAAIFGRFPCFGGWEYNRNC